MLTAEERRLKRLKRRRIVLSIVSVVVVLVIGYFAGRSALNAVKAWQARRHAGKAFRYIEAEQWIDARNEATAAYQLRPTEPQAMRAVARFLSRTRQIEALDFWKQLRTSSVPLSRQDLRDEAAIAISAGETLRAEEAVRALLATKPEPTDWLLAAQLSIHKGVPEGATGFLDKIFNDARATEREQFQAALLKLTTATDPALVDAAWAQVEKLSRGQSATALDALVILASRALSEVRDQNSEDRNQRSGAEKLSRALETHPLAKAPQKLIALDLLEHVDPAQRQALIGRAIAEWKDAEPSSLAALATWLNGKGEYQRELDTIPLSKTLQNRELFLQRLDALAALDRWEEVKQLVDNNRFPLDPFVQKMYLARCNAKLGEKVAAENNWQRALEDTAGDPTKLMTVGDYAEKNGLLDIAASAYNNAIAEAPKLRAAYQGRLRVAQAGGNTKNIHAVVADMLRVWPNDPAVQNDEAYLRLLLLGGSGSPASGEEHEPPAEASTFNAQGSTLDEIEKLGEKLVQKNPASMPHRTLLALARLRQNRPADALATYANIQVTPRALTPSALAVHAAVLSANGHEEDARAEVGQVRVEDLLPEERALIAGVRK